MRHSRSSDTLVLDPEIDRTFRRLLKERREREKKIEEQQKRKVLRDYVVPSLIGATSCIITTTIQVNNFELKPGLIQMV